MGRAIGTWRVGAATWTATALDAAGLAQIGRDVSAVFLVAFTSNGLLAVRNERGWDLPGGHVEAGESLIDALRRETAEEASASFDQADPFAAIASTDSDGVMVFYRSQSVRLRPFAASRDALDRQIMAAPELLKRYQGDQRVLAALLEAAQR